MEFEVYQRQIASSLEQIEHVCEELLVVPPWSSDVIITSTTLNPHIFYHLRGRERAAQQ